MSKPKLSIMVGNIVSGKSTWIKKFLAKQVELGQYFCRETPKTVVLSKDALRRMLGAGRYVYDEKLESIIHESLISMLHHFMRNNIDIILDETNMDKITRNQYLFLTKNFSASGYDYETIAVVMPKISKEVVLKRIAEREGKIEWASTSKEVWARVWERKNSEFEMPTKEEGFDKIWEMRNE